MSFAESALRQIAIRRQATLVLDRAEGHFPSVNDLVRSIQGWVGTGLTANLYLSPPLSVAAFGLHTDEHDVLALQLLGRKLWRIGGTGSHEQVQCPGSTIHIAAGTPHTTETSDAWSLHLTLSTIDRSPLVIPGHPDTVAPPVDNSLVEIDLLGERVIGGISPLPYDEPPMKAAGFRFAREGGGSGFALGFSLRLCLQRAYAEAIERESWLTAHLSSNATTTNGFAIASSVDSADSRAFCERVERHAYLSCHQAEARPSRLSTRILSEGVRTKFDAWGITLDAFDLGHFESADRRHRTAVCAVFAIDRWSSPAVTLGLGAHRSLAESMRKAVGEALQIRLLHRTSATTPVSREFADTASIRSSADRLAFWSDPERQMLYYRRFADTAIDGEQTAHVLDEPNFTRWCVAGPRGEHLVLSRCCVPGTLEHYVDDLDAPANQPAALWETHFLL